MRLCENEQQYRRLEHSGELKLAIGAYAIGQRTTTVLRVLARARAWSHSFGDFVPVPKGYDRTTWNDILDALVLSRLGDRRCLDCGSFFRAEPRMRCFIGLRGNAKADRCPLCGKTATEPIGCIEGVTR